jgi:hypothetical protein
MIVLLFVFIILLQAICLLGNTYAAVKFYKLHHRWGFFIGVCFGAYAAGALVGLTRYGFGPRQAQISWWPIVNLLIEKMINAAGIAFLNLFLFGWINGVGEYAQRGGHHHAQ